MEVRRSLELRLGSCVLEAAKGRSANREVWNHTNVTARFRTSILDDSEVNAGGFFRLRIWNPTGPFLNGDWLTLVG